MPILVCHPSNQHRLIASHITLELFYGVLVQIHMRPAMIAQRVSRLAPRLKNRGVLRMLLDTHPVHEPICWRQPGRAEGFNDL